MSCRHGLLVVLMGTQMKTNMKTILVSLILIGLFAVVSHAQTRTVTGNYCGSTYGSGAGTFGFRVGSEEMDFEMEFHDAKVKTVRFNISKLRVGDEFVIKYRASRGSLYIRAITGTGKRKRVSPCSMD